MKGVIYHIINTENGKRYIGSTVNPDTREKRHYRELENGEHHSVALQRAWEKYGEERFKFEIIETVEDKLREREEELIENGEYNVSSTASGGDLISGHPNKEEIEKRKRDGVRSFIESLSEDERKSKYGRDGKQNGNWKGGKTDRKTTCDCENEKNWRADNCRECYDKEGENNPFYGKSHSEETKKRISEKKKGEYNGDQNKRITDGKSVYESLGKAAEDHGVSTGTIHYRINADSYEEWTYA